MDEALAQTLQGAASPSQAAVDVKTCRTMIDLGRRSRRATICMAREDWDVLVKAAHGPAPGRARSIKLSSAAKPIAYAR